MPLVSDVDALPAQKYPARQGEHCDDPLVLYCPAGHGATVGEVAPADEHTYLFGGTDTPMAFTHTKAHVQTMKYPPRFSCATCGQRKPTMVRKGMQQRGNTNWEHTPHTRTEINDNQER